MRKLFIFSLTLMLVLSGCAEHPLAQAAGDFSFCPPQGYSIVDITDHNCAIARDEDSVVAGGMEVTALSPKSLKEDHAKRIMGYLQEDFHKTNNIEYITSHWGEKNPIVTVHLRKHEDSDTQTMYSHIFFQKDSRVYHIWLNEEMAGEEAVNDFVGVLK